MKFHQEKANTLTLLIIFLAKKSLQIELNTNRKVMGSTRNIYTKYSKHWSYTVAHTIDCVCSKMLNHGLNHGLFLSLFKLIPSPIH